MATFSFITEFLGGTYISQHDSPDLRTACMMWRDHLIRDKPFPELDTDAFSGEFDFYIDFMPPVAVETLANIWTFGFAYEPKKSINSNIIQTDTSNVQMEVATT